MFLFVGIKGQCSQTQLLHLWLPSHGVQKHNSCHTPYLSAETLQRQKNLLLIVGTDSQNRTLNFFSGLHSGHWVNLLQRDDPEILLALSNENMWVILFLLALC